MALQALEDPPIYLAAYNLVAQPILGAVLLVRLRRGKSREGWAERWGAYPPKLAAKRGPRVWVHAASVGEVMAATPILKEYRARRPDDEIVITAITPGGHEVASGMLGKLVNHVHYAPFDVPRAVRRAVGAIQPDLYVGMETELWPNLLHHVNHSGARLALVNGRLSDRSFPRYSRLKVLTRRILSNFDRILTQTPLDADRFRAIGAPAAKVEIFGNAKFDQAERPLTDEEREALRGELRLGEGAPVLVVGSTRSTEEERMIYQAYREARLTYPDLALIHAPRHIDRSGEIETLMREYGFCPVRRSNLEAQSGRVEQLILDTFGELGRVYAVADVALIGNSLTPPGGGQNLLQPLAQGVPVVYGPYMQNFRDLCTIAEKADVARPINSPDHLTRTLLLVIEERHETDFSSRAIDLVESNRGAAGRYAEALVELMQRGEN